MGGLPPQQSVLNMGVKHIGEVSLRLVKSCASGGRIINLAQLRQSHSIWINGRGSVGDKVTADIIRKCIEYQMHEEKSLQLHMFKKS